MKYIGEGVDQWTSDGVFWENMRTYGVDKNMVRINKKNTSSWLHLCGMETNI